MGPVGSQALWPFFVGHSVVLASAGLESGIKPLETSVLGRRWLGLISLMSFPLHLGPETLSSATLLVGSLSPAPTGPAALGLGPRHVGVQGCPLALCLGCRPAPVAQGACGPQRCCPHFSFQPWLAPSSLFSCDPRGKKNHYNELYINSKRWIIN